MSADGAIISEEEEEDGEERGEMIWCTDKGCELAAGEGRNGSEGSRGEGEEGNLLISELLSQREQRLRGQQAACRLRSLIDGLTCAGRRFSCC